MSLTRALLTLCGMFVVIHACPKGFEVACNSSNICVMDMGDDIRPCIRKGGLPGVLVCATMDPDSVELSSNRKCIKDLQNGDFGFAKNLRDALKEADEEEKSKDDSSSDDDVIRVDDGEDDV